MTYALLPYTARNIWFAAVLLIVFTVYVACTAGLMAGIRAHNHHGYEGEAAGLGVAILMLLDVYLVPFVVPVSVLALQRGSKPVSAWVLLLGLLPTIGLVVLVLMV
jgi:hypothetical protein